MELLILVSLLVLSGTIMVGSANGWVYDSQHFQLDSLMTKQLFGFGIGVLGIFVIMLCDFKLVKFMSWPFYGVVLILLLSFFVNTSVSGLKHLCQQSTSNLQPNSLT